MVVYYLEMHAYEEIVKKKKKNLEKLREAVTLTGFVAVL